MKSLTKFSKLLGSSVVKSEEPKRDPATALMVKVKNGDRGSFEKLYNDFKGPVMTYISTMINDRDKAEDLTQEVFLKIYRHRETYEPTAKFTTWAWTIAKNLTLDHIQKKETQIQPLADSENESAIENLLYDQSEEVLTAEGILLEQTDSLRVKACIDKLPERQKEALLLRTVSELPYEEISSLLQIQVGALKSLLHRAKEALTTCLGVKSGASNV